MKYYSYNVVVIFLKYYLVGIKGTGMSALALCLKVMIKFLIEYPSSLPRLNSSA